jgi:hypothetical protein
VKPLGLAALAALAPVFVLSSAAQQKSRPAPPPPAPVAKLQATSAIVSQFEDGPPLEGGAKLAPGETAFFRFDAIDFFKTETGKVQIVGHIRVEDPHGTLIVPQDDVNIATTLSQEDKDWKPRFRSQFQIPGIAPPGTYHVKYEAQDQQTKQTVKGELAFEVAGHEVPPSKTLVVEGIGFYRTADDETPLRIAAYRPGDMVWVRFDVTGYKYGEQNSIDVAYDVAVTAADGKQLFAQQDAAVEKSQAFYPQPWIPGAFSLTLQPNMNPGVYSISVTARDALGKQTATNKADFKVE